MIRDGSLRLTREARGRPEPLRAPGAFVRSLSIREAPQLVAKGFPARTVLQPSRCCWYVWAWRVLSLLPLQFGGKSLCQARRALRCYQRFGSAPSQRGNALEHCEEGERNAGSCQDCPGKGSPLAARHLSSPLVLLIGRRAARGQAPGRVEDADRGDAGGGAREAWSPNMGGQGAHSKDGAQPGEDNRGRQPWRRAMMRQRPMLPAGSGVP